MFRLGMPLTLAALLTACAPAPAATMAPPAPAAPAARPAIDRGPTRVPIEGDPNGLWWDGATSTLLIADSAGNRILKWTDGGGAVRARDLPAVPAGTNPGLGQLVMTRDGRVFVTRFGMGTTGGVVFAAADGTTGTVPGLDPHRRRIGLAVAADGTLYDGYFVKDGDRSLGAVARLDPAGTETDVLTGMTKPVGVLVDGADLIASDQAAGAVVKAPLAAPSKAAPLAAVAVPDLLCQGPGGSLFTGGTAGEVRQISRDGKVRTLAGGFASVRGVAYDAGNRRLFAAEHAPKGGPSAIRIVPVD